VPPLVEVMAELANAALVILLAGFIGFEREAARRPAGLRTHIVVALASWLLVRVGLIATTMSDRSDPIRIVQAVIYGISFIGAGTIFTAGAKHAHVVGLTTAASLLATTSIAVAVGFGQHLLACIVTALILLVLMALRSVERLLARINHDRSAGDVRHGDDAG
jgi:putative Mg2+ transporter-C (MgtC) family protein